MARDWQIITSKDFSGGEDSRSAPSAIPPGFVERGLNIVTSPNGWAATRPGYQLHYGYVPLRVSKIVHNGTEIQLKIETSDQVDLTSIGDTPVLVYGKLPAKDEPNGGYQGDFGTDNELVYYPTVSSGSTVTYTPSDTTETFSSDDHGLTTKNILVEAARATSSLNRSNSLVVPDEVLVNHTTYDVTLKIVPTASSEDYYPYFLAKDASPGFTHIESFSSSATTITVTIPASTHGLDSYNIVPRYYEISGGVSTQRVPQAVTINPNTGEVVVTIDNPLGNPVSGEIILAAAPSTNFKNVAAVPGTNTITIPNATSPFAFFAVYAFNTNSQLLELVIPNSVNYDDAAKTFTIEYYLASGSENVEVYYEYGTPISNRLVLTDQSGTSETYSSDTPQLTVWGIPHKDIYRGGSSAAGHVTHLDVYARPGESRPVCGLGGVLFAARTKAEVGSTYGMDTYYVNLRARLNSDTNLAPLFSTTSTPRTRGIVTDFTVEDSRARCTAVTYVLPGVLDVTLSFAGKTGAITLGAEISTEDYLTVSGVPHQDYNGDWQILAVQSDSSTETVLRVACPNAYTSDFDDSGLEARAGVFTDQFPTTAPSTFAADDKIVAGAIGAGLDLRVKDVTSTTVTVSGVTEAVALPAGLLVFGVRTSDTLPLRNLAGTATVTNLVKGDMLQVGALTRQVKVKAVNTVDKTITLDEALTVQDGTDDPTEICVVGRWIPIEIPESSYTLPTTTVTRHFNQNDYLSQPILRSTIINDSMFFTNQDDEILKFDGANIYRAGIVRWQPQLFVNVDETTGSITNDNPKISVTAVPTNNKFTVGPGDGQVLQVGDRLGNSEDSTRYTVVGVTSSSSADYIYVDKTITNAANYTTADTLQRLSTFVYYFRLKAIDANNNVVASAATGAGDFRVEVHDAAQIKLRLVGLPCFDFYDYDRIELDVFRTKKNAEAPFYKIATTSVSFDTKVGYIDILDASIDDILADFDTVSTTLLGAELGTGWDQPLRAKYITSTDNRLVLANLKDYPELNITLRKKAGQPNVSAADLSGFRWLFRRDNTDSGTTTDMVNRVAFEFVNTGAVSVNPASDVTNNLGASFTVTKTSHGLSAGHWVYLFHSSVKTNNDLTYSGWWQIASTTTNTFTINFTHDSNHTPSASDVDRYVVAASPSDVPVWLGDDWNLGFFNANPSTTYEFNAMMRLGAAINAAMRLTDTTLAGYEAFTPWLVAGAGAEFNIGQCVVRQPLASPLTLELVLGALSATTPFDIFVNNLLRASDEAISAQTRLYPSRVIVSYQNYPEIFDNPQGDPRFSTSAIEVNAEDGQEITGVIPFFGVSVFSDSRGESMIAVFKTNSIHMLDPASGRVQKVEQPYGGCTAPYSITQTRRGIVFANESGVYRLNIDLSVDRIGRNLERRWRKELNREQLAVATGHNYIAGNQYKISVPVGQGQSTNNYVFSYDFTKEEEGNPPIGAWVRADNHNATGWANLGKDSLWASTTGEVFKIRNANDATDYRDDEAAISVDIVTRAEDFGIPSLRKVVSGVYLEFHNDQDSLTDVMVSTSMDLSSTFTDAGSLTYSGTDRKTVEAWFSLAQRKGNRIQTRIQCSAKDAPLVLAGLGYRVAGLAVHGVKDANELT